MKRHTMGKGAYRFKAKKKKVNILEKSEIKPLGNLGAYTVYGSVVRNSEVIARDKRKISNQNKINFRKPPASSAAFPAGAHQQSSTEVTGNKRVSRNLVLSSREIS